jgi:hypothetical protein
VARGYGGSSPHVGSAPISSGIASAGVRGGGASPSYHGKSHGAPTDFGASNEGWRAGGGRSTGRAPCSSILASPLLVSIHLRWAVHSGFVFVSSRRIIVCVLGGVWIGEKRVCE